jgi:hypothetical protein
VLKIFSDSDWATDTLTRKSTSGAVIMAGGCRLHAHSRGQDVVALSSCEAELYAGSEAVKEGVLLKERLLFIGMGEYRMELLLDDASTRALIHQKGPGSMKHLDDRALWMQDLVAAGGLSTKKIERIPTTPGVDDPIWYGATAKAACTLTAVSKTTWP